MRSPQIHRVSYSNVSFPVDFGEVPNFVTHTHTLLQNYVPLSSLVPIVSPKSTCLSTQKTETLHANRKMKDHSNQPIHHTSRRNRSLRTKDMLDFLDGKPMTHDVRCRKRCDRCV